MSTRDPGPDRLIEPGRCGLLPRLAQRSARRVRHFCGMARRWRVAGGATDMAPTRVHRPSVRQFQNPAGALPHGLLSRKQQRAVPLQGFRGEEHVWAGSRGGQARSWYTTSSVCSRFSGVQCHRDAFAVIGAQSRARFPTGPDQCRLARAVSPIRATTSPCSMSKSAPSMLDVAESLVSPLLEYAFTILTTFLSPGRCGPAVLFTLVEVGSRPLAEPRGLVVSPSVGRGTPPAPSSNRTASPRPSRRRRRARHRGLSARRRQHLGFIGSRTVITSRCLSLCSVTEAEARQQPLRHDH